MCDGVALVTGDEVYRADPVLRAGLPASAWAMSRGSRATSPSRPPSRCGHPRYHHRPRRPCRGTRSRETGSKGECFYNWAWVTPTPGPRTECKPAHPPRRRRRTSRCFEAWQRHVSKRHSGSVESEFVVAAAQTPCECERSEEDLTGAVGS